MQVKLAESAGFCYGVERAVNAVYDEINKGSAKIYTYGPIVHNDIVVNELKEKGVSVIRDIDELKAMSAAGSLKDATVIIRAHGVGRDVADILNSPETKAKVVDATCPFVKKIHKIVTEHHKNGEKIIVTGTASHPEVIGILGQIGNDAVVIENASEAEAFACAECERNYSGVIGDSNTGSCRQSASSDQGDKNAEYCIVSQTTFNVEKFKDIVDIFSKKLYHINVVDTICNATQLRQKEAYELSRTCDAVIVIGGRHSSNASKLYDICSKECSLTYFIESLQDFKEKQLDSSVRCVGITAGASTPKTIIQEVLNYVRN